MKKLKLIRKSEPLKIETYKKIRTVHISKWIET